MGVETNFLLTALLIRSRPLLRIVADAATMIPRTTLQQRKVNLRRQFMQTRREDRYATLQKLRNLQDQDPSSTPLLEALDVCLF